MNDKEQTSNLRLVAAGSILAVFYMLAGLIPIDNLWGFNHLKYLPGYSMIIYGLLFFLVLIPRSAGKLNTLFGGMSRIFGRLALSVRIALIAGFAILVFYWLRVHVHSLGDGYQRIYQIEQGYLYYHTEVLDFFLHGVLYRTLNLFGKFSGEMIYTIFSIAAGTAFILSVYFFKFNDKEKTVGGTLIKVLLILII